MSIESQKRIGIDARLFGLKQKGLGRYIQKMVEGLEQQDHQNQYFIFLRKNNWSEYTPQASNFQKVLADYRWYSWSEQLFFPLKIRKYKIDLIHFPHFNVPVLNRCPFVVTIHDLVLRRFPTKKASSLNPLAYWFKNLAYRFVIRRAIKKASQIIAVSKYTAADICKYYQPDPLKIKVIYEGRPDQQKTSSQKNNFQNLKEPYLLYVGNAYPHKNLEGLINSFLKVAEQKKELKLVLVGEIDYFYKRLIKKVNSLRSSLSSRIIFTGFVSDDQLIVLYQNANLYVFPSFYEGFGLPPLEAMTYGCPVASSQEACLPEILGQAAAYFNPDHQSQMATLIIDLLNDSKRRQVLIQRGFERIKRYSWSQMAREIISIYNQDN